MKAKTQSSQSAATVIGCACLVLVTVSHAVEISDPSVGCSAENHSCGKSENTQGLGISGGGGGGSGKFTPPDPIHPAQPPSASDPFGCKGNSANCVPAENNPGIPASDVPTHKTVGGDRPPGQRPTVPCRGLKGVARAKCLEGMQ